MLVLDDARHGQRGISRPDPRNRLLGFLERQPADPVDVLGENPIAGPQIRDHPLQFWPIGMGPRRLLAVDACNVILLAIFTKGTRHGKKASYAALTELTRIAPSGPFN
jgi:hypothetical protein